MPKRIVLVFDYSDATDEAGAQKFLEDVARDLNEQMGHYVGYQGWRVEDDSSSD
jgi:hypothetical protein